MNLKKKREGTHTFVYFKHCISPIMETLPDSCTQQGMGPCYTMPDILHALVNCTELRGVSACEIYISLLTPYGFGKEREDVNAGTLK